MPIFEFTCRKCGHGFEEILSLAELEAGDVACPACGSRRVERGFSTFATKTTGSTSVPACGNPGGGCGVGGGFT